MYVPPCTAFLCDALSALVSMVSVLELHERLDDVGLEVPPFPSQVFTATLDSILTLYTVLEEDIRHLLRQPENPIPVDLSHECLRTNPHYGG